MSIFYLITFLNIVTVCFHPHLAFYAPDEGWCCLSELVIGLSKIYRFTAVRSALHFKVSLRKNESVPQDTVASNIVNIQTLRFY